MGSDWSNLREVFGDDDLQAYMELTYLTSHEIFLCYKAFLQLDTEKVKANKDVILPMETMQKFPSLKANPFKDRICRVFSSKGDGSMSFEDFLDMMSTFNEKASKDVKIEYAFRIYDFDEDDFLSERDLAEVMLRLFPKEDQDMDCIQIIINKILEVADLNEDGGLSYDEFYNVMVKDPELMRTFRMCCG